MPRPILRTIAAGFLVSFTVCWLHFPRTVRAADGSSAGDATMKAKLDPASGHWDITEGDKLVLRYNYRTNEPGAVLDKVTEGNRKYARARSDYPIHSTVRTARS